MLGAPRTVATLITQSASAVRASAAYAARRSCGERHVHAGAGSRPAIVSISPRLARLTPARAIPRTRLAAGASPGVRFTI